MTAEHVQNVAGETINPLFLSIYL